MFTTLEMYKKMFLSFIKNDFSAETQLTAEAFSKTDDSLSELKALKQAVADGLDSEEANIIAENMDEIEEQTKIGLKEMVNDMLNQGFSAKTEDEYNKFKGLVKASVQKELPEWSAIEAKLTDTSSFLYKREFKDEAFNGIDVKDWEIDIRYDATGEADILRLTYEGSTINDDEKAIWSWWIAMDKGEEEVDRLWKINKNILNDNIEAEINQQYEKLVSEVKNIDISEITEANQVSEVLTKLGNVKGKLDKLEEEWLEQDKITDLENSINSKKQAIEQKQKDVEIAVDEAISEVNPEVDRITDEVSKVWVTKEQLRWYIEELDKLNTQLESDNFALDLLVEWDMSKLIDKIDAVRRPIVVLVNDINTKIYEIEQNEAKELITKKMNELSGIEGNINNISRQIDSADTKKDINKLLNNLDTSIRSGLESISDLLNWDTLNIVMGERNKLVEKFNRISQLVKDIFTKWNNKIQEIKKVKEAEKKAAEEAEKQRIEGLFDSEKMAKLLDVLKKTDHPDYESVMKFIRKSATDNETWEAIFLKWDKYEDFKTNLQEYYEWLLKGKSQEEIDTISKEIGGIIVWMSSWLGMDLNDSLNKITTSTLNDLKEAAKDVVEDLTSAINSAVDSVESVTQSDWDEVVYDFTSEPKTQQQETPIDTAPTQAEEKTFADKVEEKIDNAVYGDKIKGRVTLNDGTEANVIVETYEHEDFLGNKTVEHVVELDVPGFNFAYSKKFDKAPKDKQIDTAKAELIEKYNKEHPKKVEAEVKVETPEVVELTVSPESEPTIATETEEVVENFDGLDNISVDKKIVDKLDKIEPNLLGQKVLWTWGKDGKKEDVLLGYVDKQDFFSGNTKREYYIELNNSGTFMDTRVEIWNEEEYKNKIESGLQKLDKKAK